MTVESNSLRSLEAESVINKASKTRLKKNKHGAKGESLILKTLKAQGKKVLHALKRSNRLGYDIETMDQDGNKIFHEVKSSSKENFAPSIWYIAKKQFDVAQRNLQNYFFWFVNSINTKKPIIQKFAPGQLEFRPGRYQIQVSSEPEYKMKFQVENLYDKLNRFITKKGAVAQRKERTLSQEKRLIAISVLTRQTLAQSLNANSKIKGINKVQVNLKQSSSVKPFHLKYIDDSGKEVLVDLKVNEKDHRRDPSFKFYITRNRLETAMKLSAKSPTRRELWHCVLDHSSKKLEVDVYDIAGKDFWSKPENHTSIDYYSFKVKK